jgi:hypothetical protein
VGFSQHRPSCYVQTFVPYQVRRRLAVPLRIIFDFVGLERGHRVRSWLPRRHHAATARSRVGPAARRLLTAGNRRTIEHGYRP